MALAGPFLGALAYCGRTRHFKGVVSARSVPRPRPLADLKVVVRSLSELKPNPRNARTHSRRQIRQIADSIAAFGFNNPILIDDDDVIIAGHGRVEAAKVLGMSEVPTVCLAHMSEDEKRAYVIADNKLAEKAGWDKEILAVEFETLFELAPELDLTVTGFEMAEIDLIIGDEAGRVNPMCSMRSHPRCRRSCRHTAWRPVAARLSPGAAMQPMRSLMSLCCRASPRRWCSLIRPTTSPSAGTCRDLGTRSTPSFRWRRVRCRTRRSRPFLTTGLEAGRGPQRDGAIAFVCMDWRHLRELLAAGRTTKLTFKKFVRVGQDRRRYRHLLSLAARADRGV